MIFALNGKFEKKCFGFRLETKKTADGSLKIFARISCYLFGDAPIFWYFELRERASEKTTGGHVFEYLLELLQRLDVELLRLLGLLQELLLSQRPGVVGRALQRELLLQKSLGLQGSLALTLDRLDRLADRRRARQLPAKLRSRRRWSRSRLRSGLLCFDGWSWRHGRGLFRFRL